MFQVLLRHTAQPAIATLLALALMACLSTQVMATTATPSTLSAPTLLTPANAAIGVSVPVTLTWSAVTGASWYEVEVSTGSAFAAAATQQFTAASATLTIPQLPANTTLYWRVADCTTVAYQITSIEGYAISQTVTHSIMSPWCSAWSFTTAKPTPMAAPILLTPTNAATGVALPVTLTWSAVTGATGYEVEVSTSSTFAANATQQFAVTAATITLPKLPSNTTIYWRVQAMTGHISPSSSIVDVPQQTCAQCQIVVLQGSSGQVSPWSNIWSFTTLQPTPLTAPTLLTPANAAIGVSVPVTLTWSAVTGATGYEVEVSTDSAFAANATRQLYATAATLTIQQLAANTTYYWQVQAETNSSSAQASPWSSAWSFTTLQLAAPTLLTPANAATGVDGVTMPLTLTWNAVTGATVYEVEISTSSSFTANATRQFYITSPTLTIRLLAANTTYYWQVQSEDEQSSQCGNSTSTQVSPWSSVWSFTTLQPMPLTAPTLLTPTNAATGVTVPVTLTWSAVTGAIGYAVEVSTSSTFAANDTQQLYATGATLTLPQLAANTTYYWQVQAEAGMPVIVGGGPMYIRVASSAPINPTDPKIISVRQCGHVSCSGGSASTQNSPWSSAWSFTTLKPTPLTAPTLLTPANTATGVSLPTTLTWDTVTGATGYQVEVSTASAFAANATQQFSTTGATLFVPALSDNTTYYWRVQALERPSPISCCILAGPWSATWSFTTDAPAPTPSPVITSLAAPILSSPADGAMGLEQPITLTWKSVTAATGYTVQYADNASFADQVSAKLTGTSLTLPTFPLADVTKMYWRVEASTTTLTSPWSTVWMFELISK